MEELMKKDLPEQTEIVIVTGLSGAGKTRAADWFEDQGYYCVDNMPPTLIYNFLDLALLSRQRIRRAVFVIDVRGGAFFDDLQRCITELRARPDVSLTLLFVEASTETLIERYNESRRNHPMSAAGPTTKEVIEAERKALHRLREEADHIIDTTNMKVARFNLEMRGLFADREPGHAFSVNILSFGYKHGVPREADLVLDMRCIPNPYYVPSLRHLTGNNKKVQQYVMRHEIAQDLLAQLHRMLQTLIPYYIREDKYHLNVAFGCTGGQHRSVVMANQMADLLRGDGFVVTLEHREL